MSRSWWKYVAAVRGCGVDPAGVVASVLRLVSRGAEELLGRRGRGLVGVGGGHGAGEGEERGTVVVDVEDLAGVVLQDCCQEPQSITTSKQPWVPINRDKH